MQRSSFITWHLQCQNVIPVLEGSGQIFTVPIMTVLRGNPQKQNHQKIEGVALYEST